MINQNHEHVAKLNYHLCVRVTNYTLDYPSSPSKVRVDGLTNKDIRSILATSTKVAYDGMPELVASSTLEHQDLSLRLAV